MKHISLRVGAEPLFFLKLAGTHAQPGLRTSILEVAGFQGTGITGRLCWKTLQDGPFVGVKCSCPSVLLEGSLKHRWPGPTPRVSDLADLGRTQEYARPQPQVMLQAGDHTDVGARFPHCAPWGPSWGPGLRAVEAEPALASTRLWTKAPPLSSAVHTGVLRKIPLENKLPPAISG